jgi:catechol 2,3-dioxygenase-like lactoylglutathione lyase family enzyme
MSIYNHTGIVVTDLERSKRFYQDVLGFEFWYEITPPDEMTAKLNSLQPPLGMIASYYVLEGFVLEFLYYSEPDKVAPFTTRSMNEPGLTHLSIGVDDIYATAQKAVEYGGAIIEDSDVGAAIFIRDPDGQLLELLPTGYRDRLPPRP